jgi:hypothetical protein
MAPVPATLPELVQQLGSTFSPFERLKILSRAWAVLRAMTPQERLVVGSQLGLDHADDILDAIARRSGHQAAPMLVALIEKAQMQGTAHLPELIADLRDPRRRSERLSQGALGAVESTLAAAAAEPVAKPVKPAAPAAPKPAPPAEAPIFVLDPEPAPPPAPMASPKPVPVVVAPEPAAPLPPAVEPPPAPKPQPPVPPLRMAVDDGLAAKLAEARSLIARFQVFRQRLADVKRLPADGLRSVVEAFPDGWARRRALVELLRTGNPATLGDALGLVEALGSERDRSWCLGTLAETRALSPRDRESLLAAVPSATARRRLERRLG